MKKVLLLIAVLFSLSSFSQTLNLEPNKVYFLDISKIWELDTLTVPDGKIWQLIGMAPQASNVISINGVHNKLFNYITFPEQTKIKLIKDYTVYSFSIIEYNLPDNGIAVNFPESKQLEPEIQLFPNPTTSMVNLNSEKEYDITVYDMDGRQLMKTTGNTLDLSNLSDAVYIVKAFDKSEKTTLSYKVVKQ